jgi:hypothetical protein
MSRKLVLLSLLLAPALSRADGAKPYSIKTEAQKVKAGEKGKISLHIQVTKPDSHVSDEAPLKITLKGEGVKLDKESLKTADVVEGKGSSPRFEVPFTAEKKGEGSVTADMAFIVCTKEVCERETEKVIIPVSVQ